MKWLTGDMTAVVPLWALNRTVGDSLSACGSGAPTPSDNPSRNVLDHDRLPSVGSFPFLGDHDGNAVDVAGVAGGGRWR